jgi:hypothetical protein
LGGLDVCDCGIQTERDQFGLRLSRGQAALDELDHPLRFAGGHAQIAAASARTAAQPARRGV